MPATPAIDPTACLAGWPESSALIEAAPEETPSSNSVMVSIRNLAIRPTPLCIGCFESCGVAEPVRINCPDSPCLASHSKRMASHSFGSSCHSSMSLGDGPAIACAGSIRANWRAEKFPAGSERDKDDLAKRLAVVVFPHHFGPRMRTAPKISRLCLIALSMHLSTYLSIPSPSQLALIMYFTSCVVTIDGNLW